MNGTYLVTAFADKDQVKALGARWDPARRQWYVPAGRDITPFTSWLPEGASAPAAGDALAPATPSTPASTELAVPQKGIALSRLLAGVAQVIGEAFKAGVWTLVEVVDTRVRNGHVYMEVSERDGNGAITAKATAVIWASQANRILPEFQQATGAQLGPGIKLLVRARPVFKPQFGFSLEIDAIDPDYTLGDLEARKREIRERLQREGLFDLNRQMPRPWDYNHVLVVAPEGGAGLGDFQAEASRLESHGICRFIYAYSRFQGDGAAADIRTALLSALQQIELNHPWHLDAVVIIRGGGAVNDLAWLNDYGLVRCVCELGIPVLTGIGHERDNTVLDEVANARFDTPSKVIAGIEHTIVKRIREAKAMFEFVTQRTTHALERARRMATQFYAAVETGARQELAQAKQQTSACLSELKLDAAYQLRVAAETSHRQLTDVQHLAQQQLHQAQRDVPALMSEIRAEASQSLRTAKVLSAAEWRYVAERASTDLRQQREAVARSFDDTATRARRTLSDARANAQALMREIAGQGPEKTLNRGFALVRDAAGQVITSATTPDTHITIEFRDGQRAAELKGRTP
ncbi:MAG: exodeoxyribonuclease VII large subunit [Burkholderiales bacterium]|nr:exodeoxyribonuclease VII large subunit [Burkholderiales bacterium]